MGRTTITFSPFGFELPHTQGPNFVPLRPSAARWPHSRLSGTPDRSTDGKRPTYQAAGDEFAKQIPGAMEMLSESGIRLDSGNDYLRPIVHRSSVFLIAATIASGEIMSTTVQTVTSIEKPQAAAKNPAANAAWSVNITLPAPKTMPADRLAARAELVRKAMTSGTY